MVKNLLRLLLVCILSITGFSQDDVCSLMVRQAAHNLGISTSSSDYLNSVFDNYCKQDGTSKSSSAGFGLSLPDIPLTLTGNSNDVTVQQSNFCRNYSSTVQARSSAYSYQSTVVEKALQAANDCLKISKTGNFVSYNIMTPTTLAINFQIGAGTTLNINGLSHSSNVSCVGRAATVGTMQYDAGTSRTLPAGLGSYVVRCSRKPSSTENGQAKYSEEAIVMGTNSGAFNIYWPADTVLPLRDASDIQKELTILKSQQKLEALPKGAIIPWSVKNGAMPNGWVPCDGTDNRCADLRGLFLRGTAPADVGSSGGSDTHAHNVGHTFPDGGGFNQGGTNFHAQSDSQSNVPRYYGVLYIMKVVE